MRPDPQPTGANEPEFTDREPHFIVTDPIETTKPKPKRSRPLHKFTDGDPTDVEAWGEVDH